MTIIQAKRVMCRAWLHLFVAFCLSFGVTTVKADLLYNTAANPSQLANVLNGPGLGVSNLTITRGAVGQYGIFGQGVSVVGIDAGVFMTTGDLGSLQGPNTQGAYSANTKVNYLDPDLATISNNAR